jgi:hypothetical protein
MWSVFSRSQIKLKHYRATKKEKKRKKRKKKRFKKSLSLTIRRPPLARTQIVGGGLKLLQIEVYHDIGQRFYHQHDYWYKLGGIHMTWLHFGELEV